MTGVEFETERFEEDEGGPTFTFPLVEDPNRKNQLFGFRKETSPPPNPIDYRPSEKQLLQEGKLGASEFSARLQRVAFGTYGGQSACLIAFQVNFAPKNRGWFRFRKATIQAEAEKIEEDNSVDNGVEEEEEEEEDDAFVEMAADQTFKGPLVVRFHPSLIRGHIQTAAETYGISVEAPIAPPGIGVNISAGWAITAPRESSHLIQGILTGSPERGVKWIMKENEISKSGIYEQPTFAMIVRFDEARGFVLTLNIKATTYGGLDVTGKSGSRIKFMKSTAGEAQAGEGTMAGLKGGTIQVGSRMWGDKESGRGADSKKAVLDDVDLEQITQIETNLLKHNGPGGGTTRA
jgi:hypothetical protein